MLQFLLGVVYGLMGDSKLFRHFPLGLRRVFEQFLGHVRDVTEFVSFLDCHVFVSVIRYIAESSHFDISIHAKRLIVASIGLSISFITGKGFSSFSGHSQ